NQIYNLRKWNFDCLIKILPFCLPSHTPQFCNPPDVGVFGPLKTYYRQEVCNLHCPITKNNCPDLLSVVRHNAFTIHNIQAGFRVTGISPFHPE
ncbi:hypothetical protein P167DRAFT_476903, partial [Morchella conica CCBAS932]